MVELPKHLEIGGDGQHECQVLLVRLGQVFVFTDDEVLMVPDEGGLFFLRHALSLPLLLGFFAGTTTALLAAFVALALETVFDRPYPVEAQLVDLLDDVKDTQLMLDLSPVVLQTVFVKRRAIGDNHLSLEASIFEGLEKHVHMWLVIFVDHLERHRKVTQRVGGKQNGAATVMNFINAQDAGEVGVNEIPVGLHVDLCMCPKEARMDIAQRQRQQILLLHPAHDRQIRHAITNQRVGHGVTDFQGIAPSGWHTWNRGLGILATVPTSLVDTNLSDDPGMAMQRRSVCYTPCVDALAFAFRLALRTGVIHRLDRFMLDIIRLTADKIGISHEDSSL